MSKPANYFRIGIFILGAAFILAGGLIIFGLGQFFKKKIHLETYVDSTVQGVEVGSPLKFRGVTVGQVVYIGFTAIDYATDKEHTPLTNYVRLLVEMDREIVPQMFAQDLASLLQKTIERGLRVQIRPQGITGNNYLEIEYLDPKRFPPLTFPWTPQTYYIPSAPSELSSLLDSVNKIMRDMEQLNVHTLTKSLLELLDKIKISVDEINFKKINLEAQETLHSITKAVENAQIEKISDEVQKFLLELSKSNETLKKILLNVEPVSRINSDDINATLENLHATSDHIRRLSSDLEQDPSRLIWRHPLKNSPFLKKKLEEPARNN